MKCKNCKNNIENKDNTFCSSWCSSEYRYVEYIKKWKMGKVSGKKGKEEVSRYIRRYLFEKCKGKCQRCGWKKINKVTKRVPLTINHIDGRFENNKEKNLEMICPNCHSLTPNYGSLNRVHGRYYRRIKAREKYGAVVKLGSR